MNRIDRRQALALALGAALISPRAKALTVPAAGGAALIPLNYNENPLGPGPNAREAIIASSGEGWRYAD
ncbi:MAG: hypothetical protein ACKO7G_11195, partial [Gammaproteobacteria bacterium]